MTTEGTDPMGIDADELEAQAAEPLPDREAMSVIALDDSIALPLEPDKGPEPMNQPGEPPLQQ